uniref:beta-1,4-galactosyltransferase 4-like isoform X2 n=1 Tax=Myxine glutinosa TaxID=7769 RepID=UPI00358ECD4F
MIISRCTTRRILLSVPLGAAILCILSLISRSQSPVVLKETRRNMGPGSRIDMPVLSVTKCEGHKCNEIIKDETPPCTIPPPRLLGRLTLSFPSNLALHMVSEQNPAVRAGGSQPRSCTAVQKVAVLVPCRDREKHLTHLLANLHPILQRQQLHYTIYVIHQAGDFMFNRAKLLNAGFLEAMKDAAWDCIILHDVDLIPEDDRNLYLCGQQPRHLVVGRNSTGYILRYKGYFGGVTALSAQQFRAVNGFSNIFWGWGGEDDELRQRVEYLGMWVERPPAEVARYTMILHGRDEHGNRINSERIVLLHRPREMMYSDGMSTCRYKFLSRTVHPLYINVTVDIGTDKDPPV